MCDKFPMKHAVITQNFPLLSRLQKQQWYFYLVLGIFLNAAVWGLVLIYLKVLPQTFTSYWAISVMGNEPGFDVTLPDSGKATPYNTYGQGALQDPRKDYLYLANSPTTLEDAAAKVGLSAKKFGKPKIVVDEGSRIIAFEMKGPSPTEAQQKSIAFYQTINQKIEQLRSAELERRNKNVQATLQAARRKVNEYKNNLSRYQALSNFSSSNQISELAKSIEQLRQRQAELLAQKRGLVSRIKELSNDLNLSPPELADAYKLQADEVFKQQLEKYAQASTALVNLSSRFKPRSPQLIHIRAELEAAAAALQKRGSSILGRPISQETLMHVTPITLDPKVTVVREELYRNLLNTRTDQQGVTAQNEELQRQLDHLERRLRNLTQDQFTVDTLKRDLQIAETIFANNTVKLELGKESIYSDYPSVQLVVKPSLPNPDEPTAPNTLSGLLGGLAGSLILTTGLILLWNDKRES